MKSTYCEYILEKILSTSEVGPILALIAPSSLLRKRHPSSDERDENWRTWYKTTQIGDKIIDRELHWEVIYNCQTLHVAILDSIMKEEDAQRMGKTRSCGKKNHFASMCRLEINRLINKIKVFFLRGMIPRENWRNVRKTVENNLGEYSDQYDCSDEDDYFEGSIKHIAKIGKVKAVSRQSDIQKTVKITRNTFRSFLII